MEKAIISPEIKEAFTALIEYEGVKKGLVFIEQDHEKTVQEQIAITEIPAPPFKEETRAADFKRRLEELQLHNVQSDAVGNVFGVRPGTGGGPKIFVSAHLDTVFPEGTDTTVQKKDGVLHAPGIGDDTRGLAELLAVVRAMNEAEIPNTGDIIFGGTVGEEGAGDLRGVKAFFAEHTDIDAFVSLDGEGENHIIYKATGSFRYTVTYKGPGGHSFAAFGTPSATHALGRAIAALSDLQTPESPKTTFSVGEVTGGTSVNAIAQEAAMAVDLRSNDGAELEKLDAQFIAIAKGAARDENARWGDDRLTVDITRFGDRAPASQPADAQIVQIAAAALETIGKVPDLGEPSSTDSNFPMSLGIPSVTIGLGGKFGGAHTLEEWHDPAGGHAAIQKSFLTILGMSGVESVIAPLLTK